jgi:predicted secreted Zn-dependent protease
MYSATAIPESATASFDIAQIQTRCVEDFQSNKVAGQSVTRIRASATKSPNKESQCVLAFTFFLIEWERTEFIHLEILNEWLMPQLKDIPIGI